ncbi:MAG: histidinol-phosphatase [Campylobacterales bacterium]|nr:histidinol-phosphatase [Campylobacterales bacterium]
MIVDLHNHTTLCNHAEGEMEEYIIQSISNGTKYFGFSDHAPMDFDKKYRMSLEESKDYEKDLLILKEKYKNKIEILLGYEVDFLKGYMNSEFLKKKVDYFIGSVHFLNKWGFDNPEFIGEFESRDIDKIWEEYFFAIESMAKMGKFDIVGHLDLIKIFKYLPNKDIKTIAKQAIQAIKKSNMTVEINSAGFRKPIGEQYPSRELLELVYENGIDITFGSDGHKPEQVGMNLQKCVDLAKEIGFTQCVYFRNRDKKKISF